MTIQPSYRIIFHIDMNAFFASCAIAEDSSLANKPIVIAHNDALRKSIILTASYEARKYGIYTTMQTHQAIKLCPEVIIVEPDHQLYSKYSKLFFDYLCSITPKLEQTSIDEGYLDVTDVCQSISAINLATKIQKTLLERYKLPCSIGIAPNKFLAKMASDLKKPLGITILRKREIDKLLWPLPIGQMYNVGKVTKPKLEAIGIKTIGDIVTFNNDELLKQTVGNAMAEYLQSRALGNDDSPVDYLTHDEVSSISNSHTFDYNVISLRTIKNTLKVLANTVSNRLIEKGMLARTVGINIKYGNFKAFNRSAAIEEGIKDSLQLWSVVEDIFDDNYDGVSEVRLVGVFATRLIEEKNRIKQYSIFDDMDQIAKEDKLERILKDIKRNYGNNSINIGYYKYQENEDKE